MQESAWQNLVQLALDLNADEELQAEFREHPGDVLGRYGIELTGDELAGIRRVLNACSDTGLCIVPLPNERPRGRRGR